MRQEQIIWFALLASTFIYAILDWIIVGPQTRGVFDDALRSPMTIGLYVLAVFGFIAGTAASIIMRNRPLRLRMIVSLALYETCAIYGLLAAMLGHDWRLYLAPWAIALIGFFRMFPTAETS